MKRLIWSALKPVLQRVTGNCAEATLLALANDAQERLLNRPTAPVGARMKIRACVNSNCVVLPRQVRTVEVFWCCNQPGIVASEFWEAVGWASGGYGLLGDDACPGDVLVDNGTACSFANVVSDATHLRKIQAVASDPNDNGKTIHLRYIDSNGNRKYSGGGVEGETLALSTTGVLTSSAVARDGLYHVVKQATNYPVRLYSYDEAALTQTMLLATYEPSETAPIYRACLIPGLSAFNPCCGSETSDDNTCDSVRAITLMVRLQHVPVVLDNDPFVLGNLAAMKLAVKAIKLEEQNEQALADANWLRAYAELDGELSAYLGDGAMPTIRTPSYDTWSGGGIINANGGMLWL